MMESENCRLVFVFKVSCVMMGNKTMSVWSKREKEDEKRRMTWVKESRQL